MVNKEFKEVFAKFSESPDRVNLRDILKQDGGEFPYIDFKEMMIEIPILAKHILAFSNSGGGIIIFGVLEKEGKTFEFGGLTAFTEKTDIKKSLSAYLPHDLKYELYNFDYDDSPEWKVIKGKKFQVLSIDDCPQSLPFLSLKSSEPSIFRNRVYCRTKTNSEEATHEDLKKIINRRLDTNISTTEKDSFREHIDQLEILYSFVPKYHTETIFDLMNFNVGFLTKKRNPNYPEEDFEAYISKLISEKKSIINSKIRF